MTDLKKCINCNELIKKSAIKCRYCYKWMEVANSSPEDKWNLPLTNTRKQLLLENRLLKISCFILGIAIIWIGGYGYYMFSRLAIFLIMLYLFIKNYKSKWGKNERKLRLFGITGIIYNPLLSITLTSFLWIIVDLIVIIQIIYKLYGSYSSNS